MTDSDIDALVEYLGDPRMQIERRWATTRSFASRWAAGHPGLPQRGVFADAAPSACSIISERKLGIKPGQTTADGASRCPRSSASARAEPRRS